MVFVTHDVREALLLANRVGLVKDGNMILLGPPSELLNSNDPEAQAFAACISDGDARSAS
jgi:osmoprotectant transport system ATP-binding protein